MDRAYKFLDKVEDQLLRLMDKEIHEMHPKELDMIVALCDAHENVCEFIELAEKMDGKPHDGTGLFGDNPRKYRR